MTKKNKKKTAKRLRILYFAHATLLAKNAKLLTFLIKIFSSVFYLHKYCYQTFHKRSKTFSGQCCNGANLY